MQQATAPLTKPQREHLGRILAAGGTAIVRSGANTMGKGAWSRTTLNVLAKNGLIVLTPGREGRSPMAAITDAGRAAYGNSNVTTEA